MKPMVTVACCVRASTSVTLPVAVVPENTTSEGSTPLPNTPSEHALRARPRDVVVGSAADRAYS